MRKLPEKIESCERCPYRKHEDVTSVFDIKDRDVCTMGRMSGMAIQHIKVIPGWCPLEEVKQ